MWRHCDCGHGEAIRECFRSIAPGLRQALHQRMTEDGMGASVFVNVCGKRFFLILMLLGSKGNMGWTTIFWLGLGCSMNFINSSSGCNFRSAYRFQFLAIPWFDSLCLFQWDFEIVPPTPEVHRQLPYQLSHCRPYNTALVTPYGRQATLPVRCYYHWLWGSVNP